MPSRSASHAGSTGSSPVGVTNNNKKVSVKTAETFFCLWIHGIIFYNLFLFRQAMPGRNRAGRRRQAQERRPPLQRS